MTNLSTIPKGTKFIPCRGCMHVDVVEILSPVVAVDGVVIEVDGVAVLIASVYSCLFCYYSSL